MEFEPFEIILKTPDQNSFINPTAGQVTEVLQNPERYGDKNYYRGINIFSRSADDLDGGGNQLTFYLSPNAQCIMSYIDSDAGCYLTRIGDHTDNGFFEVMDRFGNTSTLRNRNLVPLNLGIQCAIEFCAQGGLEMNEDDWE